MSDLAAGLNAVAHTSDDAALGLLLEAVTVPVYAHSGGKVLHGNEALRRLTGHDGASLRECRHEELATEAWRESLKAYGEAALAGQEQAAMELALACSNGSVRQVEIAARTLVLDGRPVVVVTCQDLSDIQHVQASMLTLSQMLHQIINGGPLAKFVVDQSKRITHWNRACERMTGLAAWEMLGRDDTWRAFYDAPEPLLAERLAEGATAEVLTAAYGDGIRPSKVVPDAWEGESFVPKLDGGKGRWLFFSASPLFDSAGALVGAVQTMQDVTERHEAEAELRRHRNELEALVAERSAELHASVEQLGAFLDNAPVGAAYMARGKIERHNTTLAEMFGIGAVSLQGWRGERFFRNHEEYTGLMAEAVPALAEGRPLHRDMWMRHSDGSDLWVQVIAYPGRASDPASGTWWLIQDRTAMRRAQDELQANFERMRETNQKLEEAQNQLLQQDKMASIGQLAAGVAHEINNPVGFVSSNLHTLRGYVQDLLGLIGHYQQAEQGDFTAAKPGLAAERQRIDLDYLRDDLPQLLTESEDGLVRVKRIVQDLKDFSRVDQEDWQEADLNAGLESTLNVVRHEVKYKATVERELSALPRVRCVAAQLNQVFMNLIVNASHAINGQGVITLASGTAAGPECEWAWIEVRDTGSGMTPAVIKRIFEPFYTTKPVGKGTGLGLSLSFSIVQRHQGALRVRSTPGEGSAFRLWVPVPGPREGAAWALPPFDY